MDEYGRLKSAYETAKRYCLTRELTVGAETAGRLDVAGWRKTEKDFKKLVTSVAIVKIGYQEFKSFGFEDAEISNGLARLESRLQTIMKQE
ncbi:MAG: hypothetical protein AABX17_02870 [Nanoarchaeota archaeon]|mgnify:CR=1 FL=1